MTIALAVCSTLPLLSFMNIYIARILKISVKNFKGFRNVQKCIETSDGISVATLTHHILGGAL